MSRPAFASVTLPVFLLAPVAAHAALPDPVLKLIAAAEASGDADQVAAVLAAARAAYPDDEPAIAAIEKRWNRHLAERAEKEAKGKELEIRSAGLFDRWEGKGELGALRASGNSDDVGVTATLALERIGIDWRHKLRGRADYQRSDGETTREKFLAAYEPNFDIAERAFIYGLAQGERDRVQGYLSRYSVSGGIGYRFFDREDLSLAIKAGPAWRKTDFIEEEDEQYLAGLAALDFDWQFAKNLSLTQTASAYVQNENSSFASLTGLEAGIVGGLSARLSYRVEHDTDPPEDAVKTDTLSRFTLIYDF